MRGGRGDEETVEESSSSPSGLTSRRIEGRWANRRVFPDWGEDGGEDGETGKMGGEGEKTRGDGERRARRTEGEGVRGRRRARALLSTLP